MKRGHESLGFTIIETLIFLAVSSALITSAFILIGGSQNQTEFNQAVNDIRAEVEQVANTVATGYYAASDNTSCQVVSPSASAGVNVSLGGGNRGANADCIYLGRIIYFSNGSDYELWNVAGRRERQNGGGTRVIVTDMSDAQATAFGKSSKRLKSELRARSMASRKNAVVYPTAAIGFFGTLGSTTASNPDLLESQSQQFDVVGMPNISLGGLSDASLLGSVQQFRSSTTYNDRRNPEGGVKICFDSGTTDERAILTIGGRGRASATELTVEGGKCAAVSLF